MMGGPSDTHHVRRSCITSKLLSIIAPRHEHLVFTTAFSYCSIKRRRIKVMEVFTLKYNELIRLNFRLQKE